MSGIGTGGFGATASAMGSNFGGNGMDPLTLSAIIGGGSALLNFLKKDPNEEALKIAQQNRRERINVTRPTTSYYESFRNLPATNYLMQKLNLGNLRKHVGEDTLQKYGIDLEDLIKTIGLDRAFSETPDAARFRGGGGRLQFDRSMYKSIGDRFFRKPGALDNEYNANQGLGGGMGGPRGYAYGGIVTRPQVAMVGERGPEAIVPLRGPAPGLQQDLGSFAQIPGTVVPNQLPQVPAGFGMTPGRNPLMDRYAGLSKDATERGVSPYGTRGMGPGAPAPLNPMYQKPISPAGLGMPSLRGPVEQSALSRPTPNGVIQPRFPITGPRQTGFPQGGMAVNPGNATKPVAGYGMQRQLQNQRAARRKQRQLKRQERIL